MRPKPMLSEGLLSAKFSYLAAQTGLPDDVQADLLLTDKEFGLKYKRGKSSRLEVLENLDNRLQIGPLRSKLAEAEHLTAKLSQLLGDDNNGLSGCLSIPKNLNQSRVVLELSFLERSKHGPSFALDTDALQSSLANLAVDDVAIDVVRKLLVSIDTDHSITQVAELHGLGRQTVYDRKARLTKKLEELVKMPGFSLLINHLKSEVCFSRGGRRIAPLSNPIIAILQLDPGQFPSVHDVVSVALWGIARAESQTGRFVKSSDADEYGGELILE